MLYGKCEKEVISDELQLVCGNKLVHQSVKQSISSICKQTTLLDLYTLQLSIKSSLISVPFH